MSDMSITPEQIKAARERLHMTQQQLAEEVGVSLRTVSGWERGEYTPQNRTGAVVEVLGIQTEDAPEFGTDALLRRIGALAKRRREELGIGRVSFAKEAGLGSDKTIQQFEFGRVLPSVANQMKIEKALGWRLGAIEDVMRMHDRKAADIRMEEVDAEDSMPGGHGIPGVRPLAFVSSEELLAELGHRLAAATGGIPRPYGKHLDEAKNLYGLAASTNVEHLEDEDDQD